MVNTAAKDLCGGPGWGRVGCRDWQKVRSVCCTVLAGICSQDLEVVGPGVLGGAQTS